MSEMLPRQAIPPIWQSQATSSHTLKACHATGGRETVQALPFARQSRMWRCRRPYHFVWERTVPDNRPHV